MQIPLPMSADLPLEPSDNTLLYPPPTSEPVDSSRRAMVDQARTTWMKRLIDVSRRNNLLYFRELKKGTLDLSSASPETLAALIRGDKVPVGQLLPSRDAVPIDKLRDISRRALANLEERGVQTLYVALGMASWRSADGGRPPQAAILLLPVAIESRGSESNIVSLRRNGDLQVNTVLLHVLENQYGCNVTPEALLVGSTDEMENLDLGAVYERLRDFVRDMPGFTIQPAAVLGNFWFQKIAMVNDLRDRGSEMASHDLIAALAGDATARARLVGSRDDIDPASLDRRPPGNPPLILDADSSQQAAIVAALQGQNGVLHGPPGTGKSQTIANLLAASAATGRRVLFVAEKRAALEVVLKRLEAADLGYLALDLHKTAQSKRQLAQRFAENLQTLRAAPPVDLANTGRRLEDRRQYLNIHATTLHTPRLPSNLSAYELQGRVLTSAPPVAPVTRWRGPDLLRLSPSVVDHVQDLLHQLHGRRHIVLGQDTSAWSKAVIQTREDAQRCLDAAQRLASYTLPSLSELANKTSAAHGLTSPRTIADLESFVDLVTRANKILTIYASGFYELDLTALATALSPAERGGIHLAWAKLTSAPYKRAQKSVLGLRTEPVPAPAALRREVADAAEHLAIWRERSSPDAIPDWTADADTLSQALTSTLSDLNVIAEYLSSEPLDQVPLTDLVIRLQALAADTTTPFDMAHVLDVERELAQYGITPLLDEFRRPGSALDDWPAVFEHAWLVSCLDQVRLDDPGLANFQGSHHQSIVREFCDLDERLLAEAAKQVRRAHAERVVATMNAHPSQEALVRREAAKKTRHLPVRQFISEAPDVLTALCPIWMASPLSVSQLLPADQRYFDLVIFDEASQVLPEDAVTSLLRAQQAVVAGDQHQLPPTTFFASGENEEQEAEYDSAVEGFESLLDIMSTLVDPWRLDWHYRSRDEKLIAFSNRHIYGDRLVTFPSAGGMASLRHELVSASTFQDGDTESAGAEVQRVIELIFEQAAAHPDKTLGVITMGIRHAERIQAALDRQLRVHPELEPFFDTKRLERFFIKNLERVQGDERDNIILSIGYGKDHRGKLPHRFGPLLFEGGERRLNVAITRARDTLTLVSSFDHHDIDPTRTKARGVELLRLYLEYAASHGRILTQSGGTGVPLNPFEADVYDALSARGIRLIPQWGASRYRIDFVAQHPDQPGRFVLAIECDGASYHSAPTARDRDRLRQRQLEALGWRFHRIWSTDWFLRRQAEIERAVDAYQKAVKQANETQEVRPATPLVRKAEEGPEAHSTIKSAKTRSRKRPPVSPGGKIDEYSEHQLTELAVWIQSDGCLRTDEELLEEMMRELGFQRRGTRIEGALRHAILAARRRE